MDHATLLHMADEGCLPNSSHISESEPPDTLSQEDKCESDPLHESAPPGAGCQSLVLTDGGCLEDETDVDLTFGPCNDTADDGVGTTRDTEHIHAVISTQTCFASSASTGEGENERTSSYVDQGVKRVFLSKNPGFTVVFVQNTVNNLLNGEAGSMREQTVAKRYVDPESDCCSVKRTSTADGDEISGALEDLDTSLNIGCGGEPADLNSQYRRVNSVSASSAIDYDSEYEGIQVTVKRGGDDEAKSVGVDKPVVNLSTDYCDVGNDETAKTNVQDVENMDHGGDQQAGVASNTQGNGVPADGAFSQFVDLHQLLAAGLSLHVQVGEGDTSVNQLRLEFKSILSAGVNGRKQLKKLLRSAVWDPSCGMRETAWKLICGQFHKLQGASLYFELEKEMFGDFTAGDEIPLPAWLLPQQQLSPHQQGLVDQFSEHFLTLEGIRTAHKMVMVICQLSPDITFCPAMLPLIYLFLHYMDAGNCFSCVSTLLASKMPVYLTQTKVAAEASKRVLRDLAKKHAKSSFAHLVRSCADVDSLFDEWLLWIYCDLPFHYLVYMTDSYLLEGIKVLYRVVLAILILYTKYSGMRRPPGSAISVSSSSIRTFCKTLPVSPAKLLKVAFGIRGLTRRRIWKLHSRHEVTVNSEMVSQVEAVPRVASSLSMGTLSSARVHTRALGFQKLGSNILTPEMMATICGWLPFRFAIYRPVLLYTSIEHGTSLMTLYKNSDQYPYTIIVIETTHDEIFGAFCAGAWCDRHNDPRHISYFGTGETFLFTLVPERCKYEWVGTLNPNVPRTANMFLAGDASCLFIGGGNGVAIALDETFDHCRTETCDTYKNPPLVPGEDFTCNTVEVFGFQ